MLQYLLERSHLTDTLPKDDFFERFMFQLT